VKQGQDIKCVGDTTMVAKDNTKEGKATYEEERKGLV